MNTYKTIKNICEGLIAKYDQNDPNYKAAQEADMLDNIVELFADCYDAESFLEWLDKHDGDILVDFRFAEIKTYQELIEEIDSGDDNPDGVYNIDLDEWEELETEEEKIDYIKDHLDCLMSSDVAIVVSW